MAREIERKFLVMGDSWRGRGVSRRMVQGYLCRDPERTVRVRIAEDRAWITVKGLARGCARMEHEYGIPVGEAEELLAICLPVPVEKTRHEIPVGDHLWEVDEYHGGNAGLIVAEIELAEENENFERPEWLGHEVTEDFRYSNAALAEKPYGDW